MKRIQSLTLAVLLLTPLAVLHAVEVVNLRCEHLNNPLGMDVAKPRLSWVIAAQQSEISNLKSQIKRGVAQTAYQVLVASSEDLRAKDQGDLWNSGTVLSDQSIAVCYDGKPLVSENRYWWKVRATDNDHQSSVWSKPAMFLTGKMRPEDWRGKWIGADLAPHGAVADKSAEKKACAHARSDLSAQGV